jgi:hypothetical protein
MPGDASSSHFRNYRQPETRQAGQRGLRTNGADSRFRIILQLVWYRGEKIVGRMVAVCYGWRAPGFALAPQECRGGRFPSSRPE